MSRLNRYQESFSKHISKKEYCYYDIICEYEDKEYLLPVLLLTIMNTEQKKRKLSYHGYHAAYGVYLLDIYLKIILDKERFIARYSVSKLINVMNSLIYRMIFYWYKNMESVSRKNSQKIINLIDEFEKVIYDDIILTPVLKNRTDMHRNFLIDNDELKTKFKCIKLLNEESCNSIKLKYSQVVEFICLLGYYLGEGDYSYVTDIINIGKSFGEIIKYSIDYGRLEQDINELNNKNIVISSGMQKSYETFISAKKELVVSSMKVDYFGVTLNEILGKIDERVDLVIEDMTYDLKTSYSTLT